MANRTFAIGDIHGDSRIFQLLSCLPELDKDDTSCSSATTSIAGPSPRRSCEYVRASHEQTPAKVVALRGNHEDAWLRVIEKGWDEFVLPAPATVASRRSARTSAARCPRRERAPRQDEL